MTFKYLKRACRKDGKGLLFGEFSDRTRGNDLEVKEEGFRLDIRKFFTARLVRQ